jgi:hypothetical protein
MYLGMIRLVSLFSGVSSFSNRRLSFASALFAVRHFFLVVILLTAWWMMYYLSFVYQLIEFFLVQYLLILILSL